MPSTLNLVFCGTPAFAVPTLNRIQSRFHVALVVTQPDRPKGRGLGVVASPIKESALRVNLPVVQPDRIKNNEDFRNQLTAIKPDAIVVVGYGRIIPQWMLDLPRLGNINLHASLLPKYRGAAPIQWALARGETVTGVTTMKIDSGLDTGDILLQEEISISDNDTAETLAPELAAIGADLVVKTLSGLQTGEIVPRSQDEASATLAPILTKEDGLIDFARPAREIINRMRGFQPWPGAYSTFRGKKLQIMNAVPLARTTPRAELVIEGSRLFVGCGAQTTIEILELQLEGKKRTTAADFIHGYRPRPGEKLGL